MPIKKSSTRKLVSSSTRKGTRKPVTSKRVIDTFSVPVYSLAGMAAGSLELPKEIFGKKVNNRLLAQAARVYLTNQKTLPGFTKKRGEVVGSKAKIYAQKGTGRARHGAITAPIFVGGGITFGPKPRKIRLQMPKKLKRVALYQALSDKLTEKKVVGLSSLEKATGKTKEFGQLLKQLSSKFNPSTSLRARVQSSKFESALIITDKKMDSVVRGVRNLEGVHTLPVNLINAYEVLRHNYLLFTKDAVSKLVEPKELKNVK